MDKAEDDDHYQGIGRNPCGNRSLLTNRQTQSNRLLSQQRPQVDSNRLILSSGTSQQFQLDNLDAFMQKNLDLLSSTRQRVCTNTQKQTNQSLPETSQQFQLDTLDAFMQKNLALLSSTRQRVCTNTQNQTNQSLSGTNQQLQHANDNQVLTASSQQHVNTNRQNQNNQSLPGTSQTLRLNQQRVTTNIKNQSYQLLPGTSQQLQHANHNQVLTASSQQHVNTNRQNQNNQSLPGTSQTLRLNQQRVTTNIKNQSYQSLPGTNQQLQHANDNQVLTASSQQHVNTNRQNQNNQSLPGTSQTLRLNQQRVTTNIKNQSYQLLPGTSQQLQHANHNQVLTASSQQHVNTNRQNQNNQSLPGTSQTLRLNQQRVTTNIKNQSYQSLPGTNQQIQHANHNQVLTASSQQHVNTNRQNQNNQSLPGTSQTLRLNQQRVTTNNIKNQSYQSLPGTSQQLQHANHNQVLAGSSQQHVNTIRQNQNNQSLPGTSQQLRSSQQHVNTNRKTQKSLSGSTLQWRDNTDKQIQNNQLSAHHSDNTPRFQHSRRGRRATSETRPQVDHPARQNQRSNFKRPNQSEFHILERIANTDSVNILGEINAKKDFFLKVFQLPVKKLDLFVLTVKILSKICQSSYDELKLKMFLTVCNESFVMQLRIYLMDLPNQRDKNENSLYWKDPNGFWRNFIEFCESFVNLSPSMAMQMCRSLIDNVSKGCLDELLHKHRFTLLDSEANKLAELRDKLLQIEKQDKLENKQVRPANVGEDESEPPELFRELPIIPDHHHLMRRPFLRPNIVNGAYKDVEHYLDIQFRLMLEDCYGPLRKGILQYLGDPTKSKYDNIRVYKNVTFMGPYVSESKVGVLVKMDEKSNKRLRRMNWATSKRLLFGSLVILSKDNFKKFIVATVLDRDVKYLSQGMLPISVVNNDYSDEMYVDKSYTMIESEVYFEPYYHVLKVLQDPKFPEHLSMQDYIVKANPLQSHPKYLTMTKEYTVEKTEEDILSPNLKFAVLQDETWPTAEELGLNNSQYEAYKLALTHEFAVIQGPPGTGKTFLGVKIAKTLFQNLKNSMLVICYTNHALDQFLENMMSFTQSIARIGGQSRNKALEDFNLKNLRRNRCLSSNYTLFRDQQNSYKSILRELKMLQNHIETLENGVLTTNTIKPYTNTGETQIIERFYNINSMLGLGGDPLALWLFENLSIDTFDLHNEDENMIEHIEIEEEDVRQKSRVSLDEDDDDGDLNDVSSININTSFNLNSAETELKYLISRYKDEKKTQNKEQLEIEIQILNARVALFKEMKQQYVRNGTDHTTLRGRNVRAMSNIDRWSVYFTWRDAIMKDLKLKFQYLEDEFVRESSAYEEARMNLDREILQRVRVIGMTTTGAARLQKMVQELKPRIVIVEEAAEVLEQHIVSALTSTCEHLILIGDHQQLRPSAAYTKLARDYNIEISLFERMIKNKIPSQRLSVQHRMRPEIVSLIVPHIYPDLENHPQVENRPDIRGITSNVFFFSHNFMEQQVDDGSSRTNHKEADLALGLANYLVQQDYQPEDITILAAYSGQMFYMRNQRNRYSHLSSVKITVVDNYQGEESKIIILSLVRNNIDDTIGFLSIENRVCVALSRAKAGFYMFGNIDILKRNSELWTNISLTLEKMGSLGTSLRLKCQIHPTQITTINQSPDFDKVPEGGCLLKCNYGLECGHLCPHMCHGYDRAHKSIECTQKCEKILCDLNHVCPLMCKVECKLCAVAVEKILPCGHNMMVPCHQDPKDTAIKCTTTITVILPNCKHEMKKPCHIDVKYVRCVVKCVFRVEKCGHACRLNCHVTDDPDHEKYVCMKPCAKPKNGCTANLTGDRGEHQCPKACHETCDNCNVQVKKKRSTCKHSALVPCSSDVNDTPCKKKCGRIMPCGHYCYKKCFEICGGCNTEVEKPIPGCKHTIKIACQEEPTRELCRQQCNRTLACGHPCTERCDKPCDTNKCTVVTASQYPSKCGHRVSLPCNIARQWSSFDRLEREKILLQHCKEPCNQTLECDHICSGTCAGCYQGRLHEPCKQTCHRLNICGHQCEEPCNQVCPPCKKKCEVRCPHSQCSKRCGAPCGIPCQETCSRVCPHGECTNRCGEECTRPACSEPCSRTLECDHQCRGLCGDPCLNVCSVCNPDDFPQEGFIKGEFDDKDKFVQLQDCPHILEVEDMDTLMVADSATIAIRQCPYCRKPIIKTSRYKDIVNYMFRENINLIKEKVYGNETQIREKKQELIEYIKELKDVHAEIIQVNTHFENAFTAHKLNKRDVSLLELQMTSIYFDILDIVGENYKKYRNGKLSSLKNEFMYQIELICQYIRRNVSKISQQQQNDIKNELERMDSILKLSQLTSHPNYLQSKTESKVKTAFETAQTAVLSWHVYNSAVTKEALVNLQNAVKTSGIVTEQERKMIVQAIGLKAGHWYKCPNGHFYCIGECGGAMQIGKCIECGANVGGTSHALLSTNSHAGEIDGSSYAAWSEQNNMANFNFDDII